MTICTDPRLVALTYLGDELARIDQCVSGLALIGEALPQRSDYPDVPGAIALLTDRLHEALEKAKALLETAEGLEQDPPEPPLEAPPRREGAFVEAAFLRGEGLWVRWDNGREAFMGQWLGEGDPEPQPEHPVDPEREPAP